MIDDTDFSGRLVLVVGGSRDRQRDRQAFRARGAGALKTVLTPE
nr:hypothetical protein [Caulobacter sp. BP25]